MAKLGTEKKPVRFRVQTEDRLGEIASICEKHGWKFVGELAPGVPEDISQVEYLQNPRAFTSKPRMEHSDRMTAVRDQPKIGRNAPCPCGSGLKYKKCCMN
ncbi:MAG: SEC-C domain-containing protein [Bacteroidetes bacterium]|nr:SEC-C domain-containing protein [Bacteroidota bacterium]